MSLYNFNSGETLTPILTKLAERSLLSCWLPEERNKTILFVQEACDGCFSLELTKREVQTWAQELLTVAAQMKDYDAT